MGNPGRSGTALGVIPHHSPLEGTLALAGLEFQPEVCGRREDLPRDEEQPAVAQVLHLSPAFSASRPPETRLEVEGKAQMLASGPALHRRGLDGGRQSQRSLEWPGQARPARQAAECFSVPLLDGGDQCSQLVLVERLRGAAHVARQRDCCHGATHKQQGPGRTAGKPHPGPRMPEGRSLPDPIRLVPAVVTYTPLRARLARSQGKYPRTRWRHRDSNPSYGYDHIFASIREWLRGWKQSKKWARLKDGG